MLLKFLKTIYPDINYIYPLLQEMDTKNKIVKGFMQSGKTWVMLCISMYYYIKYNLSTVIILQNSTSAEKQFLKRASQIFKEYNINIDRVKKIPKELLEDVSTPKIMISLRNSKELEFFLENYIYDFSLIIDESDFNDSGFTSEVERKLTDIKDRSLYIWNVTATALTSLMKNDIDAGNVAVLPRPEFYKDLPNITFVKLDEKTQTCTSIHDDPITRDPYLKTYLENFSSSKPFVCSFYSSDKETRHPRYTLIKIGNAVEPQLKLSNYIYENYPDIITITYNGGNYGLTCRGNNLPQKSFIINNIRSKYSNNIHIFNNLHIGCFITYLQRRGVDSFPRIIVIAGKMADRGISFCSNLYSRHTLTWHLTEMYFIASKTMNQSNLLQCAGRLCGKFADDIPLVLYTNASNDIIKSYYIQEELIERCKKTCLSKNILMNQAIPEEPIAKSKCSKRKVTNGVECSLNKVSDDRDEGGWNWNRDKDKVSTTPDLDKVITAYRKTGSKVRKIIDYLLTLDSHTATEEQLRTVLDGKFQYDNYTKWDDQHSKYGILKKKGASFKLSEEIIKLFKDK